MKIIIVHCWYFKTFLRFLKLEIVSSMKQSLHLRADLPTYAVDMHICIFPPKLFSGYIPGCE